MNFKTLFTSVVLTAFVIVSCNQKKVPKEDKIIKITNNTENVETPEGMIWVASKTFLMGAKNDDRFAMAREKPAHKVAVDGFFIDSHEVTNKQFKEFVDETKYVTVAERQIDWNVIKNDLPPGTPKPADSVLQPGSLIFNKHTKGVVSMDNYGQWWVWKIGANWKQPEGPGSSIDGNDNYPVVHIAQEDALAYCKWSNRRLPTEAEWESAAQGKFEDNIYSWGNKYEDLNTNANTWQGKFPTENVTEDRFEYISPVKSYPANSIGLYDMAGNVWEITADLFNVNYYQTIDPTVVSNNPKGADKSYTPSNPYQTEYVMKGGSFLCHESYCASFRISARMGMEPNSGSDHIGFRTVATRNMLVK
ncbi:formylglycine-generating enzyme family protein [Polaribacter sp. SA4-12]|uniref:formylglycine-generating enzyme family protein n=1 Tax=Polaribacter sp. SA4-12 TaxID=1312072 RepID=UPI000B3BF1E9|nr:formylglycine-generating enzyme family protein [Polaribacter sp. SA4-12]ARV15072.1 sulfatase [Polaribacter sp. SA4-12]